VLELSGRHVSVGLDPCDLELAARGILWGKRANRGRNCVSVQLVLAEGGAFEPLLAALATAVRDAGAGDGEDALGEAERERLSTLASDALARGARRIGGSLADVLILAPVEPGMRMVDEEVLGPLLGVAPIEAGARAVEWINGGGHRLSASVWASDLGRARRLAGALDVGQVWINEQLHPTAQPAVALAGRGASGFGATRGRAALMEMVQVKVVSETPAAVRRPHYAGAHPGAVDLLRATVGLRFGRGLGGRVGAAALAARALVGLARGPR
jgi:acyl-CoA reductase-like NAD-dependent aldehyde dehydrogenase